MNRKLNIYRLAIVLVILLYSVVFSQAHDPKINANDKNLPQWVKLMYSDNPIVWEVKDAFEEYYKTNLYVKNTYTQYYKRWLQNVKDYVQPDGTIKYPSPQKIAEKENLVKLSRKTSNLQKSSKMMYWDFIGPEEVFKLKDENPQGEQFQISWHANVYGIDIAPSNTNILYCGTESGGIYKTTDKGLNWKLVNENILSQRGIRGIKIHPTNPDIVYANIQGKIYKTTNGGLNWNPTGGHDFKDIDIWLHDIQINPEDPEIVYLASNNGFFRSTNGGDSWTKVLENVSWSVDIKPDDPNIIYVSVKDGSSSKFYKSTNKGESFSAKTEGWYNDVLEGHFIYGVRITVSNNDPNRVYALIGAEGEPLHGYVGVFMSTDAGETWTHPHGTIGPPYNFNTHPNLMANDGVNGFYQGLFDFAIIANPVNANQIIIGGTSWWASDDGAKTFRPIGGYVGGSWAHPDMQFLRAIGNELWIANDGGLNYSTDFMQNHVARNNGISGHEFWGFGSGWNQDVLVGGRYHDGNAAYYETYPHKKFLRMGGAEASTGYVNYKDGRKTYYSDIGGKILPETFDGNKEHFDVAKFPNESYFTLESSEVEFHPYCWNIFYLGNETGLWMTEDNGKSFTLVKDFDGPVRFFEICRSDPNVIYLLTKSNGWNSKLWKTTDGGKNWKLITNSPVNFTAKATITVSAENTEELWVANYWNGNNDVGKKVWKSEDGGQSWTNITTSKIDRYEICDIMHQYGTDGGIYLGTATGTVFYRNDKMNNWINVGNGLPISAKTLRLKPFYKKGKIRNGTTNYGIWESDLFEKSKPIAQIAVNKFISTEKVETFNFVSHSVQHEDGATWLWKFPGGEPSTSTLQNPSVTYSEPGLYPVTLIVSDINGTDTVEVKDLITMYNNSGPITTNETSLSLNNSNDYAVSGTGLELTTSNLTITAWIKRNGTQNDQAGIVYTGSEDKQTGLIITSENELRYNWKGQGSVFKTKHIIPNNEWVHVAMVVELNRVAIYLNGKPKYINAITNLIDAKNLLYIGSNPFIADGTFKGDIDEVCIYNRSLTYEEIRKGMYLEKDQSLDSTIIAYYKFNEDEGNAFDYAGNSFMKLNGNAVRTWTNIPVGIGSSDALIINNGGEKLFPKTGVKLVFPETGTYPNGQVVVSKVKKENIPDSLNIFGNYIWYIKNYSHNKEFSNLTEISFSGLDSVKDNKDNYSLYKNSINDLFTWEDNIALASSVTDSSIIFSDSLTLNSFGNFIIKDNSITSIDNHNSENIFNGYTLEQSFPNPFNPTTHIRFVLPIKSFVTIKIFDQIGREVRTLLSKNLSAGKHMVIFNANDLASGIYYYTMKAGNYSETKKMILLK